MDSLIDYKSIQEDNASTQITDVMRVILQMANFDFSHRTKIMGESAELDVLAAGINMLNEELNAKSHLHSSHNELLREVHHRMKNNLQIVSSILNLQQSSLSNENVKEKLRNCRQRVDAMALVHEKLYTSGNLDALEINDYISTLCLKMKRNYPNSLIDLQFEGLTHAHFVETDKIVPLGLICCEIIMNSYEHGGFLETEKGMINITLRFDHNQFSISFTDNGVGFKDEKKFIESENLGLQLVHSLVAQIDANISLTSAFPTRIYLKLN